VFSVLSISLELLAALAVFFTSQSTLPTLVAILLAILASVQSVWWWVSDSSAWLKVWLEGEPLTFDDEGEPDLFDKLPTGNSSGEAGLPLLNTSAYFHEEKLARTRKLAADRVVPAHDALSAHARVFYAGLLAGLFGTGAAMYGLAINLYPSTLAGSIIASIGFVTLACALVSAEDISQSESESRQDGRSEQ
jgi:hypothetical protein